MEGALCCALEVVAHNGAVHEGLSRALCKRERMEGADLAAWLQHVQVGAGPACPLGARPSRRVGGGRRIRGRCRRGRRDEPCLNSF